MGTVRQATVADASAIGLLVVRAWQAAYRGVMPDDYLAGLKAEDRQAMWERGLSNPRPDVRTLVVEDETGRVVGFAHVGPRRHEVEGKGELYAINLDPDAWGKGLGRQLLAAATDELARLGHRQAILWVAEANGRARRFYEPAGWNLDHASQTEDVLGATVTEVRYRLA